MTAEPIWPGDGPNRYHPGFWKSVGTSTVPSGLSPRVETATATPIAGMRRLTGSDRAATGVVTSAPGRIMLVIPVARDGGCRAGAADRRSGRRRPTQRHAPATSRRVTDMIPQRL